nr:MAG TPA: hypothetical protein [Caudoviricetes sp.]
MHYIPSLVTLRSGVLTFNFRHISYFRTRSLKV